MSAAEFNHEKVIHDCPLCPEMNATPVPLRSRLQRYFINDSFYKAGGPVFLMIGGEGPANPAWMQYGTWLSYAQKLGALCFLLEHRFYGKSHPTE